MKYIVGIFSLVVFSFAIYCFISFGIISPTYLPYLNKTEVQWSRFYSEYKVEEVQKSTDDFFANHSNLHNAIKSTSLKTPVVQYFRELEAPVVRIYGESENGVSLIVTGGLENKNVCLLLSFDKDNDGLIFTDKATKNIHYYLAYLANHCNEKKEIAVKRASFVDFVYFNIFDCFGECSKQEDIYYKNNSNQSAEFEKQIQQRLSEDEFRYYQLQRSPSDVPVNVEKFLLSESDCFVVFKYRNPQLGEIENFASFECSEKINLIDVAKSSSLSLYFFR